MFNSDRLDCDESVANFKLFYVVSVKKKESSNEGLFLMLQEHAKDLEVKRDPFYEVPVESLGVSLYLSGILWDEEVPAAIINDEIVEIGDEIAGSTVIDIKEDSVILNDGSRNFELNLRIKQKVFQPKEDG